MDMKRLAFMVIVVLVIGCSATQSKAVVVNKAAGSKNDTVRIANDELEYEIIIIDSGFNSWLATAKPRNYYSLTFLETKNYFFVSEWNQRALQPQRYNPELYEMRIDYQSNIHYGYEVNYLLYNYFVYFQKRYNQKF